MTSVGVDIVDVERIRRLYQRYRDRFLKRVFTETEISYSFSARGDRRYERLAARFAAKEAALKALLEDPAFANALGQRQFIARHGAAGLGAVASGAPAHHAPLS